MKNPIIKYKNNVQTTNYFLKSRNGLKKKIDSEEEEADDDRDD